ncbi:uncharacterized protein PHACADRAFT_188269 [Phanerochaete carnosa HHB-10118-sp]|uniref:UbiA prenyltransferase n=1 Tax=Phanerochaete carnosa (strain HHB-10118-sp) TaxID=650164 RepID=K5VVY4_PHACS|nr:uncharacterized protein PHACADRAFT_188269 [Phanerochaete carnosa HHB-10118-sp]EKM50744.1 hypothetical protein PHACADRAFT_188269 [Phanerochaete carnosa HHB-10118-sp]
MTTLFPRLRYHAQTVVLFTISDLKTIFFPISVFACATAPLHSAPRLLWGFMWIWMHQLMCNISNQSKGAAEDAINKPWRPLPAGRITEPQATALRWISVGLCAWWSAMYGPDLVLPTLMLFITTFLYDELGLAGHYIGKNFCNIGGYTSLEIGATKIMGASREIDYISTTAVCISGALIFTTIQAQDFADVEGDKQLGRVTLPIYAPEFSRAFTLGALIGWSIFLSWFWHIGPLCAIGFIGMGTFVGLRYYTRRTEAEDRESYVFYNIWLMIVHVLPLNARTGFIRF